MQRLLPLIKQNKNNMTKEKIKLLKQLLRQYKKDILNQTIIYKGSSIPLQTKTIKKNFTFEIIQFPDINNNSNIVIKQTSSREDFPNFMYELYYVIKYKGTNENVSYNKKDDSIRITKVSEKQKKDIIYLSQQWLKRRNKM